MLDVDNKEFWKSINPGSTITLKDKQAIEDSMERGKGMAGIDYLVKDVHSLKELNGLAEWTLFLLDDPEDLIWIMVKTIGADTDLRVYFEHPEFEPGNRMDMIQREDLWLFMAPDNQEDFQYNDLKFTNLIEIEGENDEMLAYARKGAGEMHCQCESKPANPWMKEQIATVVEYKSDQSCDNPELLLFELGGQNSKEGGLIRVMMGCDLRPTELDVLEGA
jgi:hypothetical protein